MARATLTQRVETLEQTVEGLASIPGRMSAIERELSEFRIEVRNEFAAVRGELGAKIDSVESSLGAVRGELRAEIQIVDSDMRALGESLRAEIRKGDEDTRHYMRVLYEDLVDRIKTIGEGIGRQHGS